MLHLLEELGVTSWFLLAVVAFLTKIILTRQPWKNLPPGPPCLPIVGSLPFMRGKNIFHILETFTAKYGNVFTLYMGMERRIIINGYSTAKEALVKRGAAFSNRPVTFMSQLVENHGLFTSNGNLWKEQRKYVLRILLKLGIKTSVMDKNIQNEVTNLLLAMRPKIGKPFNPKLIIEKASANIISTFAFGKRFEYDDPEFSNWLYIISQVMMINSVANPVLLVPFLRFLPGDPFRYKEYVRYLAQREALYKEWIDDHQRKLDQGKEPTDLIGAFLLEMKQEQGNPNTTFFNHQLVRIIDDLFLGGTDTIANTLYWAILFMVLHPDIQQKVFEEIAEVIGLDQQVILKDRSRLPYTEAVISETQRIANLIPISPRCAKEDVIIDKYTIPKGTTVLVNQHSIMFDPVKWPEPTKFNPQRFLDSNGDYKRHEEFVPYGMGQRVCLGANLARSELCVIFMSLIQKFHFSLPDDTPAPNTEGNLGISIIPDPYDIIITPRHVEPS